MTARISLIPRNNARFIVGPAGRFVQEIHSLINTTPALRATPPPLRRGISWDSRACGKPVENFAFRRLLTTLRACEYS